MTILISGVVCSSWAVSQWTGRIDSGAMYRSKSLAHWARVLSADQSRQTNLLVEIGPRIAPYLAYEITRAQLGRLDPFYTLHSLIFANAPGAIQYLIPPPISPQERRLNAIILIGKMGPAGASALPTLINQLGDETLDATGAVVVALKEIGPAAKDAVPKLIELLDEPSAEVADALGAIGSDASAAIPALIRVSTNGPLTLRRSAKMALQRIDPKQFAQP
jgi:hypothetical protein